MAYLVGEIAPERVLVDYKTTERSSANGSNIAKMLSELPWLPLQPVDPAYRGTLIRHRKIKENVYAHLLK
jgi:hypothetical protein